MKLKTLLTSSCLLVLSHTASAGMISYNGYTLDEDTNIVTNGVLEWLQWDETIGSAINIARSTYMSLGWEVASNTQMLTLANDFGWEIGSLCNNCFYSWGSGYNEGDDISTDLDLQFVELFGRTIPKAGQTAPGEEYDADGYAHTQALFGDGNGKYRVITAYDDTKRVNGLTREGYVSYSVGKLNSTYSVHNGGVALVRAAQQDDKSGVKVPEPSTLAIFSLALLGILRIRSLKKTNDIT